MKKQFQICAALTAGIISVTTVHALAAPVIPRVYKVPCGRASMWYEDSERFLLYDARNDRWYYDDGSCVPEQEMIQETRFDGKTYTVDLNTDTVYDEAGEISERLTKVLAAFREECERAFSNNVSWDGEVFGREGTVMFPYRMEFVPATDSGSGNPPGMNLGEYFRCSIENELFLGYHNGYTLDYEPAYPENKEFHCEITYLATTMTGSGASPKPYTVAGDLNPNEKVDVVDAVLLARLAAGDSKLVLSDLGVSLADINDDGKQGDAADLTRLLRRLARLDEPET